MSAAEQNVVIFVPVTGQKMCTHNKMSGFKTSQLSTNLFKIQDSKKKTFKHELSRVCVNDNMMGETIIALKMWQWK